MSNTDNMNALLTVRDQSADGINALSIMERGYRELQLVKAQLDTIVAAGSFDMIDASLVGDLNDLRGVFTATINAIDNNPTRKELVEWSP